MKSAIKIITLLTLATMASDSLLAQSPAPAESGKGKMLLGFRMQNWKVKHFDDATQATQFADTLKKLECEVKLEKHNGHMDVQCRTSLWKAVALETHDQVHQWKSWLDSNGFDTIHGHKASTGHKHVEGEQHPEIVKYRLTEWKSQHATQPQQEGQLAILFGSLGCETEKVDHGNHTDIRVRCPEWMEVEFPTHEAAHKWMEFLNNAGFETSHEH